jgi:hypothetical protein
MPFRIGEDYLVVIPVVASYLLFNISLILVLEFCLVILNVYTIVRDGLLVSILSIGALGDSERCFRDSSCSSLSDLGVATLSYLAYARSILSISPFIFTNLSFLLRRPGLKLRVFLSDMIFLVAL